ncbi:TetR/AcrR family transcriptional regulator [Bacteroides sedimenti]|uniref:TetR family transcriptional regulator n=1 Tax=Bacteroides sedimenti TaxID=2136147 RepID=A0ABM8IHE3_9BACE
MNNCGKKHDEMKSELKERIVSVAMKAFTSKGIKGVTMDDVASELGISKRTLYEIFKDKESLLVAGWENHEREKETFYKKILAESENALEVILKIYKLSIEIYNNVDKRFFDDIKKYSRVNELIEQSREKNQRDAIAFFQGGVDQGIFRGDVNFGILNLLVREQMNFLNRAEIVCNYPIIEIYESIVFTFLRGISTAKGQKILEEFIENYRNKNK